MALTPGVVTVGPVSTSQVILTASPATDGVSPYEYQWYRDTSSGFTPGSGNILDGKTGLTLIDDSAFPGRTYYYILVVTDSNDDPGPDTEEYAEVTATVPIQQPSQNPFEQSLLLGQLDLRFNNDMLTVQIDADVTEPLIAGQAVKFTQEAGGVPKCKTL